MDIYFLVKGLVLMKDKNNAVFKNYVGGSYFGEIEVIFKTKRKCTAQIEGQCTLLRIGGEDFMTVLEQWPEYKDEVIENAKRREKQNKKVEAKFHQARKQLMILQ